VDPEVGGSTPPDCTSKPLSLHGKSRDESAPSNSNFSSALYTAVGARRSRSRYQRRFLLCPHCESFIATFQRHVANCVLRVRTHYWVPVEIPRTATLRAPRGIPRGAPTFRVLCVSDGAAKTPASGNFRALWPPVSTSRSETSSSGSSGGRSFVPSPLRPPVELPLSEARSLFIRELTGNFALKRVNFHGQKCELSPTTLNLSALCRFGKVKNNREF
jgi:hypothetical protein